MTHGSLFPNNPFPKVVMSRGKTNLERFVVFQVTYKLLCLSCRLEIMSSLDYGNTQRHL